MEVIERALAAIDELRRQRARAYRDLGALGSEVHVHEVADYEGTRAAIAQQLVAGHESTAGSPSNVNDAGGDPPLTDTNAAARRALCTDPDLAVEEAEAAGWFPALESAPDPAQFASLVAAEAAAAGDEQRFVALRGHPALIAMLRLAVGDRHALRGRMSWLAEEAAALDARREPWAREALADVCHGRRGRGLASLGQYEEAILRV